MPNSVLYDSNESLAIALTNADKEALNMIYDRYSPILFHIPNYVMGDAPLAEEALQCCFISIW